MSVQFNFIETNGNTKPNFKWIDVEQEYYNIDAEITVTYFKTYTGAITQILKFRPLKRRATGLVKKSLVAYIDGKPVTMIMNKTEVRDAKKFVSVIKYYNASKDSFIISVKNI